MIQLTNKHWAVEVPQDKSCHPYDMTFANFYPHASNEVDEIIWIRCNGGSYTQKITPGNWQFICTSKDATEADARKMVAEVRLRGNVRYTDYNRDYMWLETAIESLISLLRSKGLDVNKNWAIIEKIQS